MKKNQNIEQFDLQLKQSLENVQVPVPSGVWQSVGSAIGTNATVAAKISLVKILSLKYIATAIISGAIAWGVYEKLNNEEEIKSLTTPEIKKEVTTTNNEQIEINNTANSSETKTNTNSSNTISNDIKQVNDTLKEIAVKHEVYKTDTSKQFPEKNKIIIKKEIINTTTQETEKKYSNPEKELEKNNENEEKGDVAIQKNYSSENIIIPNAFTPYEIDGFNDCYRILIENETSFVLQIFDSNRKIVFETTDKNKCWDGKNMNTGELCPKGAYSFRLNYQLNTGYKKTERGLINLF
ncbi:MAG: gliding motility-associated C-terminal domain-containing protein [Bacteroidetes bacterium]|nr:gliding motility-associated C-terminal domain-containing protein [Bacteroidota bacterium]